MNECCSDKLLSYDTKCLLHLKYYNRNITFLSPPSIYVQISHLFISLNYQNYIFLLFTLPTFFRTPTLIHIWTIKDVKQYLAISSYQDRQETHTLRVPMTHILSRSGARAAFSGGVTVQMDIKEGPSTKVSDLVSRHLAV